MASDPAISIGNYKGVMLCNRPFVGVVSTSKRGGAPAKQAFVCGNVDNKLGATVPISKGKIAKVNQRSRKETALQRHRKWLAELQATKDQLEMQYLEDIQIKEAKHKKFMDREAKMREEVRKVRDYRGYTGADVDSQQKYDKSQAYDVAMEGELSPEVSSGTAGGSSRPMWALTEDQAKKVAGGVETAEADDLLSFANSLDFDKYINDTEISALVQNVRSRICELEAYQESLLKRTIDASLSCKASSAINPISDDLQVLSEEPIEGSENTMSLVKSVLASEAGKSVGAIHSKKSLIAVTEKSKTTIKENEQSFGAVPLPLVVDHINDATGTRMEVKKSVSNLPYIHRNPAI